MKKVLASILALSFCFVLSMPAYAVDAGLYEPAPSMTGYLYDDEGNCVEVTGYLVDMGMACAYDENNETIAATYAFRSPPFNTTASGPDSGYSSTIYLTNYYSRNEYQYKLDAVSGYWEIHDSRVSVTSAKLSYCSTAINTTVTQRADDVPVSNNFYINTGFTEYGYATDAYTISSRLTLSYLMGTSRTWTFSMENNL